ncbi:hypothetical protein ACDI110481_13830 [Acinetobacter dispersus]
MNFLLLQLRQHLDPMPHYFLLQLDCEHQVLHHQQPLIERLDQLLQHFPDPQLHHHQSQQNFYQSLLHHHQSQQHFHWSLQHLYQLQQHYHQSLSHYYQLQRHHYQWLLHLHLVYSQSQLQLSLYQKQVS